MLQYQFKIAATEVDSQYWHTNKHMDLSTEEII